VHGTNNGTAMEIKSGNKTFYEKTNKFLHKTYSFSGRQDKKFEKCLIRRKRTSELEKQDE
jgi:hypothetical protein